MNPAKSLLLLCAQFSYMSLAACNQEYTTVARLSAIDEHEFDLSDEAPNRLDSSEYQLGSLVNSESDLISSADDMAILVRWSVIGVLCFSLLVVGSAVAVWCTRPCRKEEVEAPSTVLETLA